MKKFLLLMVVAIAAAFSANAGGFTRYWFTANSQVKAVGEGKVYCSYVSSADAAEKKTTSISKHESMSVETGQFGNYGFSVCLYSEPAEGYELQGYRLEGETEFLSTATDGETVYVRLYGTQATNCGDGTLSEEECIAQHTAEVASHVDAVIEAVFSEKTTAIDDVKVAEDKKVSKLIENGEVIVVKDGVKYNVMGQKK